MKWFLLIAQFVLLYGAAIGVWGPALGKSILWFAIIGGVIGLLAGTLTTLVGTSKRTSEGASETMFAAGAIWGLPGLVIGGLGLLVWVIRAIFF